MTPTPILHARIAANGETLVWLDTEREERRTYLRHLAGQPVDVTIRKHRAQRTSQANRYYWGVVVTLLAEYCGYEREEMHECLALKFLRIEDDPVTGSPRRKRTPETDTAEFAEYVDACIRLGVDLGLVIPDPHAVEA